MLELPLSHNLPVDHLTACFNDVTNSYKFYWFLAILEQVKAGKSSLIPLNELFAEMLASVWYPSNYFNLSFGKQDRLSRIVRSIADESKLGIDAKKSVVITTVLEHLSAKTILSQEILSLRQFVPFRFLRPFFSCELRGKPDKEINKLIVDAAANAFTNQIRPGLYRFVYTTEPYIEIQSDRFIYIQQHQHILRGF